MKRTLSFGCLLFRAIANESGALGKAEVKGQQGAVLQADGPQSRAINLQEKIQDWFIEEQRWVKIFKPEHLFSHINLDWAFYKEIKALDIIF